jgi:hypothetical protein
MSSLAAVDSKRWTFWWFVRCGLALAAFVFLIYGIVAIFDLRKNDSYFDGPYVWLTIPYVDAVKAAITQKTDASKALLQGGIVIILALWSLIIAKKGERRLIMKDGPEITMFFIANILLIASFWCHYKYMDLMSSIYTASADFLSLKPEDSRVFDFRDEHVESLLNWQLNLWVAGGIVALLTLFSAHVLKEDTECPDDKSSSSSQHP